MQRTNNDILLFRYLEKFIGSVVDLGTQFFLKSIKDIYEEKQLAEQNGLDNIIDYDKQAINVTYANNPDQRNRSLLILELSKVLRPFNDKTPQSLDSLYLSDKVNLIQYILYTEFYNFISRFETESGKKITEYDYNQLVKILKETFNKYISDYDTM